MSFSWDQFLSELAAAMAAAAGVEYANTPRALWRWFAQVGDATVCTDPCSVLRIDGGSLPYVPVAEFPVQCTTMGSDRLAALERAQALYNTLLDEQGRPKRMWSLTHYRINALTPRPLAAIGKMSEKPLWEQAVFFFDVKVVPLSAA